MKTDGRQKSYECAEVLSVKQETDKDPLTPFKLPALGKETTKGFLRNLKTWELQNCTKLNHISLFLPDSSDLLCYEVAPQDDSSILVIFQHPIDNFFACGMC